jgi:hypothetical protein
LANDNFENTININVDNEDSALDSLTKNGDRQSGDSYVAESPSSFSLEDDLYSLSKNGNGLGDWVEMHGNYVLRPPSMLEQEPRYGRKLYVIALHVVCATV